MQTIRPEPHEKLEKWIRIDHQNASGQGFDDVVVEFRGDGTALIRIVEVKDYPNRGLRFEEMTAIRDNLEANLTGLRSGILRDIEHQRVPFNSLTRSQVDALKIALRTERLQIELRVTAMTDLGKESAHNSITGRLRRELQNRFGGDVLVVFDKPDQRVRLQRS